MGKGFTLIELSIVLVIIGLLIGGILVGQSLIDAARLSGFASRMQQYDIAVANFRGQYKYYPGDSRFHGGNGDGWILHSSTASLSWEDNFYYEIGNAWRHLSDTGMVREKYAYHSGKGTPGVDVPEAKYGTKGIGIYMATAGDDLGDTNDTRGVPYFYVCYKKFPTSDAGFCGNNGSSANNTLLPLEALAFDQKVDDGLPFTGNVRSGRDNGTQLEATANCVTPTGYNLANETIRACALAVRIGHRMN